MPLIDTHAHLDEEAFSQDCPEVVARAIDSGLQAIFTIGTTASSSQNAVKLAAEYPQVYAVVGIQPNYVAEAQQGDWELIQQLAGESKVIGIGETGLDRYWDYAPLDLQQDYFRKHIELAQQHDVPFVVHCREAEADVVELMQSVAGTSQLKGIMHSFCGDLATAEACLKLGLHISFAGMLTFKKNDDLRSVASQIPLDRLLVETDSPYLAPQPNRGKRNEPAWVQFTAECLAELHGLSLKEIGSATTKNARELFQLPDAE